MQKKWEHRKKLGCFEEQFLNDPAIFSVPVFDVKVDVTIF